MRVGNDPKKWGDFIPSQEESNSLVEILKPIGKIFGQSK